MESMVCEKAVKPVNAKRLDEIIDYCIAMDGQWFISTEKLARFNKYLPPELVKDINRACAHIHLKEMECTRLSLAYLSEKERADDLERYLEIAVRHTPGFNDDCKTKIHIP